MPKRNLFTGFVYSHDSWSEYWEGSLKRTNGNIGTVTTQANSWFANYGITNRWNVLATAPYIWTNASKGVLRGMSGFQDLTLAVKYSFYEKKLEKGTLRAIGVVAASAPLTDYTPDFLPLSIGSASKRIAGRTTLNYRGQSGLYLNAPPTTPGATESHWTAHTSTPMDD